jgi:peroxiredoxin
VLAGPLDEFTRLEEELVAAHEAYVAKLEALKAENPDFDESDPSKLPRDGRRQVLKRMDALVEANVKSPDGLLLAITTLHWSIEAGAKDSPARFATVAEHFANEPEIADELPALEYLHTLAGEPEAWIMAADKLAQKSKKRGTKRAARFLAAVIQMNVGRLQEAKTTFADVIKESPYSDLGKRAKGFLFEIDHLQIGLVAPDFEATTVDGKRVSLKSLRGKSVLLNFWATWCPTCVSEIPHLRTAVSRYQNRLEILGISGDEDKHALTTMIKALEVPGIQTWDLVNGENPIAKLYNLQGFPTWYLLDGDGVIRARNPFGDKLFTTIERIMKPGRSATAEVETGRG